MLRKILIGLAVVVAACVAFVAIQPTDYMVTRSATIAAPVPVIFPMVSDFHAWAGWSPWEALDPQMKKTYQGTAGALGSSQTWVGNDKAGEGKMTLVTVKPNESIGIKLERLKPFATTSEITFTFVPEGPNTAVTWRLNGHNNLRAKAAGVFMNFEKMIGADFERGLASLKTLAEAEAKKRAEARPPEAEVAPAQAAPAPVQ